MQVRVSGRGGAGAVSGGRGQGVGRLCVPLQLPGPGQRLPHRHEGGPRLLQVTPHRYYGAALNIFPGVNITTTVMRAPPSHLCTGDRTQRMRIEISCPMSYLTPSTADDQQSMVKYNSVDLYVFITQQTSGIPTPPHMSLDTSR